MDLREILAIAGAPGLYKYIAQGKGGIIVEALADGKRMMVSGSAKVSALGDIAMFTDAEEVALGNVLTNVFEAMGGKVSDITGKSSPAELMAFMEKALPSYDRERVHNSDIKKLAQWYNILVGAGMTKFIVEEEAVADHAAEKAAETTEKETPIAAPKVAKKAAPKAAPKSTTAAAPKATSRAKVANKTTTNRKSGS